MHYSLLYYVCLIHVQIDKECIYKKYIQKNKKIYSARRSVLKSSIWGSIKELNSAGEMEPFERVPPNWRNKQTNKQAKKSPSSD